jgi:hypothetical protein
MCNALHIWKPIHGVIVFQSRYSRTHGSTNLQRVKDLKFDEIRKRLDFLALSEHGRVGFEAKNIREWVYPHSNEVRDVLLKCCAIDAVPVLVARRIAYVTARLLSAAAVIVHEMYNQLYPLSDSALADLARDKDLLGYHDIRIGNVPDSRLSKFISETLPERLAEARERFNASKDLLSSYAAEEMPYEAFSGYLTKLVHESRE